MSRHSACVFSIMIAFGVAAATAWSANEDAREEKKANKETATPGADATTMGSVYCFALNDIDGKAVNLGEKFKGNVLLIVNTASQCGYTPQYADLQAVYDKYKAQGFQVLGFPANDFGAQEPGSDAEIKQFCSTKYHVTFPMFSKISVKGENKDSLYRYLTDETTNPKSGGEIKWNFTKFLVGKDGKVIARFESKIKPTDESVTKAVEAALGEKSAAH